MENVDELVDLLESLKNDAEISLLLIAMGKLTLLPTPLEDLHFKSQQIIDGWCIKNESL